MEYVDARKITRAVVGAEGPALADELFTAYLQQILVDGLFHADPHPGNVLLTRDGRLALLDLGMVGRLSSSMQEDMLKLMLAMSAGDARETADLSIKLSEVREGFDEAAFRREMTDLILRYRDASLSQIPVGRVVLDMTRLAVENGLRIVPELTLMAKTLLNLDEVARVLQPDFDPHAALRRNAASLMQRRMLDALSPANVFTSMLETREFVQALPARANRIAEALARNELRFKVEMIDEGAVIEGLQKVANRIAVGLVLAALILGAALLMQVDTPFKILGYPGLAMLLFLGAAAGGLWLSVMVLANDRGRHLRLPWKRAPD
jgi:ubiquinone biosynthesis protein